MKAKKALPYLLGFFIVLMIFSAYSNTFTSPPYLDDFHSFIQEKAVYLGAISVSSILSLSHTKFGWGRFLPVVTLALNHSLGHSNLIYFHAVNLAIHLLAFLTVFWLVRQVLEAGKGSNKEGPLRESGVFFPLCAAAIWALSPVQTSAVTYLVQRMASMQALFFTLSTACFIKARLLSGKAGLGSKSPLPRWNRIPNSDGMMGWEKEQALNWSAALFYFLCALAALCSFLSKENSVVLPIALALTDIWFFDTAWLKKGWAVLRKTGWKLRSAAVIVLLSSSYFAFTTVLPKLLDGYDQRNFNLLERLLTEGRVVVWYMSLLLWPHPARLSMNHEFEISTSLFSPLTTLPALILIAALILMALRFRKQFPVVTFGIAWFFLNLAVESTILPLELVFEHRLYLPSMGFYLSVASLFAILLRRAARRLPEVEFAKALCSALLIGAACLGLMTFSRNTAWENKLTIHYDEVTKAPGSPRANADYANVLADFGQLDDSIKYAEKAIELGKPGHEGFALAQNALTIALVKQGKFDEAIERNEEFIRDKTKGIDADATPNVCLNVAQGSISANRPQDAYWWTFEALRWVLLTDNSEYKKTLIVGTALRMLAEFGPKGVDLNGDGLPDPGDLPPALWVAMEFKKHGDREYARQIIEREYARDPGEPHLTAAFEDLKKEDDQNRLQKGKWNFFKKYVRNPFSRFNFDMAVALLVQQKNLPKFFQDIGERRLDDALRISPGSRDALLLKGWYFFNRNDADRAVGAAKKVLEGDPENSNAWLALGFFLARAGDNDGAAAAFEKVIELYPGYSKRSLVEWFCKQLRAGEPIEKLSSR